jgi:hypothetical protein
MWNVNFFIVSVIIEVTGIVTETVEEYLETEPGKH